MSLLCDIIMIKKSLNSYKDLTDAEELIKNTGKENPGKIITSKRGS